MHVDLVDK
jgi:hypothetical protein